MSGYLFALALSVVALATILYLLWKRRIREKYVFLWILLMLAICIVGAFPALVLRVATLVGLETPVNLLFAGAIVVLLIVCVQLSSEASQLQEKTRTLAEELAILRLETQRLAALAQPAVEEEPAEPEPEIQGNEPPQKPAESRDDLAQLDSH